MNSLTVSALLCLALLLGQAQSPAPQKAGTPIASIQTPSLSQKDFGAIISDYYQKPQPEKVPALIDFLEKNHLPAPTNRGALLGFFLLLFHNNPQMRPQWEADGAKTTGPTLDLFKVIESGADHLEDRPELKIESEDPGDNDFCWGAFYATGDPKYLDVLVQRLGLIKEQTSRMKYAVGASSEWSLASNALSQPKVRSYLTAKLGENLPPDIHGAIQATLTKTPNQLEREMILGLRLFNNAGQAAK